MSKRRLILCMDGTWNSNDKSDKVTNIVKLLRAIPPVDNQGISQVLYYSRGVGTGTGEKVRGGFSGAGLDDNIIDGYRFLGNNYHPGDEIFIFGFSRGAYTARSLAGLINLTSYPYPYLRTICNVLTQPIGKVDGLIRKLFKPENSRRNLPPENEETVNEYLHISALQRWRLKQVPHDLAEDKDSPLQTYRPPNLAAVMEQVGATGNSVPVVGWDGEILQPESVPWGQA